MPSIYEQDVYLKAFLRCLPAGGSASEIIIDRKRILKQIVWKPVTRVTTKRRQFSGTSQFCIKKIGNNLKLLQKKLLQNDS